MAFSPGYTATLSVGGTDISQYLKDIKFNPTRKDYQLPVLGGNAVRRMVGPVATEIDLDMFLDSVVETLFDTKMAEATPTTTAVVYHPQGAGGSSKTFNAFVLNFNENTPSEGPATATAKLVADGAVTFA